MGNPARNGTPAATNLLLQYARLSMNFDVIARSPYQAETAPLQILLEAWRMAGAQTLSIGPHGDAKRYPIGDVRYACSENRLQVCIANQLGCIEGDVNDVAIAPQGITFNGAAGQIQICPDVVGPRASSLFIKNLNHHKNRQKLIRILSAIHDMRAEFEDPDDRYWLITALLVHSLDKEFTVAIDGVSRAILPALHLRAKGSIIQLDDLSIDMAQSVRRIDIDGWHQYFTVGRSEFWIVAPSPSNEGAISLIREMQRMQRHDPSQSLLVQWAGHRSEIAASEITTPLGTGHGHPRSTDHIAFGRDIRIPVKLIGTNRTEVGSRRFRGLMLDGHMLKVEPK